MLRDCNTCRFHQQGEHPAKVVISDDFEEPKLTCQDCLEAPGGGLPLWAPKAGLQPVELKPANFVPNPGEVLKAKLDELRDQPAPPANEGVKYDAGKPGLHLLPTAPLVEIAKVLDFGAKKYAAHNWRKGMKWSRLLGALLRHTFAWARGEDKDPETGLSHLAHAGCCVLFLLQYVLDAARGDKTHASNDDRYKETA